MILEGNERGHGSELARHLLNPRDNVHITVHTVDGFVADDLFGAFAEAEAISNATQSQKYLFSLSLNPPLDADASVETFEETVAQIEVRLGLAGQPRAIVFREKNGRRHADAVWSRIDGGQPKAINLSHYKRKLVGLSRELYQTHDWSLPRWCGIKPKEMRLRLGSEMDLPSVQDVSVKLHGLPNQPADPCNAAFEARRASIKRQSSATKTSPMPRDAVTVPHNRPSSPNIWPNGKL